jgi:hypothetical protein
MVTGTEEDLHTVEAVVVQRESGVSTMRSSPSPVKRSGSSLRIKSGERTWAAPLVKANAGRLARDVDGFAVDLGNVVGVLRPIAERPMCASCHGPAGKISPPVNAALKHRYPADRAVGFAEGEIRGWFWVEVPKKRR